MREILVRSGGFGCCAARSDAHTSPGTTPTQPTGPLHALLERLACCWGAQDGVIWFELRLEARP
ncbi:hypothetical protein ACQEVF_45710 [Nonomuraea polychroma]|uniref:hypothetical protein n=1 Tax=Nonomuraea polychroma TaxID=46176 RepID=UPI003D8B50F2